MSRAFLALWLGPGDKLHRARSEKNLEGSPLDARGPGAGRLVAGEDSEGIVGECWPECKQGRARATGPRPAVAPPRAKEEGPTDIGARTMALTKRCLSSPGSRTSQ